MTDPEPQPTPPLRPPFQFNLRTLLPLFVVLGSSLAVFGAWGIVVLVSVVALATYLHHIKSFWSLASLALALVCLMCLLSSLLEPAVKYAREAGRRASCLNKLKFIGLTLHRYHEAKGCFPPAYSTDNNGKPMHSWRLLIQRYVEGGSGVEWMCDFREPWNGPKNTILSTIRLNEYVCPSDISACAPAAAETDYFAVVGPNAAWLGDKPRKLADFGKAASHTIMLVEAANSGVPWAEPRDFSVDTLGVADGKSPAIILGSDHGRREDFLFIYDHMPVINVAMADGSVRTLPIGGRSPEELRRIFQIGGYTEEEMNRDYDERRRLNWPNIAALAVWLLSVGVLLTRAVRSRKRLSVPATRLSD